jgi:hypothetical protein
LRQAAERQYILYRARATHDDYCFARDHGFHESKRPLHLRERLNRGLPLPELKISADANLRKRLRDRTCEVVTSVLTQVNEALFRELVDLLEG